MQKFSLLVIFGLLIGRIKAIQLDYSEAHRHLLQAMRKAPQHTAVGFKQTVCFLKTKFQLYYQC